MPISLLSLNIGQLARIKTIKAPSARARHQYLSMGLLPETELTVIRRAPLGDPLQIRIRDTDITLRGSDAANIQCEITNLNDE